LRFASHAAGSLPSAYWSRLPHHHCLCTGCTCCALHALVPRLRRTASTVTCYCHAATALLLSPHALFVTVLPVTSCGTCAPSAAHIPSAHIPAAPIAPRAIAHTPFCRCTTCYLLPPGTWDALFCLAHAQHVTHAFFCQLPANTLPAPHRTLQHRSATYHVTYMPHACGCYVLPHRIRMIPGFAPATRRWFIPFSRCSAFCRCCTYAPLPPARTHDTPCRCPPLLLIPTTFCHYQLPYPAAHACLAFSSWVAARAAPPDRTAASIADRYLKLFAHYLARCC